MNRIDQQTSTQIRKVMELAKLRGADVVSLLDQGRLLRHMGTRREDAIQTLEAAMAVLEGTPIDKTIKTPLDMKKKIIDILKGIQDGIATQQ